MSLSFYSMWDAPSDRDYAGAGQDEEEPLEIAACPQQRRRQLKLERKGLDRMAEAVAKDGKRNVGHLPSTRSKQAKWHHEVADAAHRRRDYYLAMKARMHEIDYELRRKP